MSAQGAGVVTTEHPIEWAPPQELQHLRVKRRARFAVNAALPNRTFKPFVDVNITRVYKKSRHPDCNVIVIKGLALAEYTHNQQPVPVVVDYCPTGPYGVLKTTHAHQLFS